MVGSRGRNGYQLGEDVQDSSDRIFKKTYFTHLHKVGYVFTRYVHGLRWPSHEQISDGPPTYTRKMQAMHAAHLRHAIPQWLAHEAAMVGSRGRNGWHTRPQWLAISRQRVTPNSRQYIHSLRRFMASKPLSSHWIHPFRITHYVVPKASGRTTPKTKIDT